MKYNLKGISLLLFAILINLSAETIHDVFFSDLSYVDIILTIISVIVGILGVIMNFFDIDKFSMRKK